MQPKSTILRIAKKEIALFFASPIAYLFLACFAGVTLFSFFWGESFFSRNIADVRPLFEWMPLLLIFLASTLTMRMWSEERRSGTLEYVLTQPAPLWHFVLGKFLGCWLLLALALLITLPLPITVAYLGDLDWGPVISGYIATLLLGATYLSIGLFVSSRSDNQIVSLISSVALCGVFYLLGTSAITHFFSTDIGEWLRLVATGSRFEAITRGVIDLRDLYFYISLIVVFLTLNTFSLERERWAATGNKLQHQAWHLATGLVLVNALVANFWLGQLHELRVDTTEGKQYSISSSTQHYLQQLQEPLLIRGYFSNKTHPLLAPLIPQLRDLMKEYEVEAKGRVRVEFIDPAQNPELEEEANQKYAIQPVPFQVADRYQAAVVNSYFNLLVQYGDEYQVLSFRDLIEVKTGSESDLEVKLRNPEHDLTRAIKKVLHSYQAGGNLFDRVKGDLVFNAYVSADSALPGQLQQFKQLVTTAVNAQRDKSAGRLKVNFLDPMAEGGKLAKKISEDYGFKPMATSLISNQHFYFYMTLAQGDSLVQIPLDDMSEASFSRNLDAAIKRFSSGFTKTVALVGPTNGAQFSQLEQLLGADLHIVREDLSDGVVSGEADILLLMAPKDLTEKQLFAVDQFVMQGGTLVTATAPFTASMGQRNMSLQAQTSGLSEWLAHQGIKVEDKIVMDTQSVPLPVPVNRTIGGLTLQEIRMVDYPYFIDVRAAGLNSDSPITANLPQATMAWASPIILSEEARKNHKVTELLRSSDKSWLSTDTNVMPEVGVNGITPYSVQGSQSSQLLGVITQGRFSSYFADKPSPLLANTEADGAENNAAPTASAVITHSPDSARIIVFSSNDFLSDNLISMANMSAGGQYLNSLQLMANTFDWALEDEGLSSIRSRSNFNRTLPVMERESQIFWEYLNYALALLALVIIGVIHYRLNLTCASRYQQWLLSN